MVRNLTIVQPERNIHYAEGLSSRGEADFDSAVSEGQRNEPDLYRGVITFLKTDEQAAAMQLFLTRNHEATEDEIMQTLSTILNNSRSHQNDDKKLDHRST